ncbi:hypothetical protein AAC387_Pa07g0995 [Persea americana]
MALGFFRVPPLFPRSWAEEPVRSPGVFQHQQGLASGGSCGRAGNFLLMVELRSRIMRFRDILDLSPCKASTPMNELLMVTVGNLQKLYPNFVSCPPMSDMITASSYQVLHYFYESLKSVGDSWTETHNWCNEFNNEKDVIEDPSLEQLGEMVMDRLGYMNAVAKEFLYVMDEKDEENAPIVESTPDSASEDFLKNSGVYNKLSTSPHTPTSVLTDATPYSQNIGKLPNISYSQPILLPLRLKAIKKLMPTDVNCFSFHMLPHASIQNFSPANQSNEKSDPDHCSADNKAQGMADALAEITKRSAYFQKIEEDVQKHATSIMEMKSTINSFQTNNMADLQKFHQYLEFHLENLTDETQVLARFDDFPTKKLETIRTASVMLSRLDGIATNLESWKVEAPMAQHLKKVECYFNKIKTEVDAIECKKDEEARRFRSHNIEFDFDFLLRIKEFMVDVSSNCIEMVLKESNEVKADADREGETKLNARLKSCSQSLWKAFQLAYRVYNFAGGQDDRADKLTKELAQEIETFTNHY